MASFNDFYQNAAIGGLNSYSVIVPNAGPYNVKGKISLPTIAGGGGVSAVVATVNQNGSPVYVGTPGAEGFNTTFPCSAGDTIQIVLSSANAVDAAPNAVKAVIGITQGVS